jgi:mRNA interferase RelE/StbE
MSPSLYRLRVPDSVAEMLRNMHPESKRKIRASLQIILGNPNEGKGLRDELAGLRSMRVSRFRIVYRVRRNIIEILAVGPRTRIYEETARLIKRERQPE